MNIIYHRQFERRLSNNDLMIVTAEIKSTNQEPYFSITAEIRLPRRLDPHSAGCLHQEIAEHFPELEKYIIWHLVSYKEPMHYVANSLYFASQGDLDKARYSAKWYNAKLEDFTEEKLLARLPALMQKYFKDMSELFGVEIRP